jgi:hypothetical protein
MDAQLIHHIDNDTGMKELFLRLHCVENLDVILEVSARARDTSSTARILDSGIILGIIPLSKVQTI